VRIGVIGRTKMLCESARCLSESGHSISFVYTCADEHHYDWPSSEFEALSQETNALFYNDLLIEDRAEVLMGTATDICISVNWLTRLPGTFINIFPHGIINAHAGDLPRYRGNACMNWAILNDEKEVCMSVHSMTETIDAGPVYLKNYYQLATDTYIKDLYDWTERVVPSMFCEVIARIEKDGLSPTPQDPSQVVLRTFTRKPEDARIDWKNPTQEIHRLIRASSHPFDGALASTEDGQIVRILRAEPYLPGYQFLAIPGQVCEVIGGRPLVACGGTSEMLLVTEAYVDNMSLKESMNILCKSLRNRLK